MLTALKKYQAWRTGKDERTMEEIGLTPKKISEALEWAISELEKGSTPEGWEIAPVEPNRAMEAAAEDYWNGLKYSTFSKSPRTWAGVYETMLAAAPKFGEEE